MQLRPTKRKEMMTTWENEYVLSEEKHKGKDDDDISNFCFIVENQQEKVTLDEDETLSSYDEL